MTIFLTIVIFLLVFSVLVIIHEFGHYIVARKAGIKVEEFGFGLPPRIWGRKVGDTLFSLNAVPFGGFVRLFGEDARDPQAKKSPRSFAHKPAWVRILVIVAGVVMNFLLAWFLLTIGFLVGIQPLILSADEAMDAVRTGVVQTEPGVVVQTVKTGGAAEKAGMQVGDHIAKINGKEVGVPEELVSLMKNSNGGTAVIDVARSSGSGVGTHQFLNLQVGAAGDLDPGFSPYEMTYLPRVVVQQGPADVKDGLKAGDVILNINDAPIYSYEDYVEALMLSTYRAAFSVRRGGAVVNVEIPVSADSFLDENSQENALILDVTPGSAAEKADVRAGDVVLQVDGEDVTGPEDVQALTQTDPTEAKTYFISRNGMTKSIAVQPDANGLIGVGLTTLYSQGDMQRGAQSGSRVAAVYQQSELTSVIKVQDVRYPLWQAPVKAWEDSWRLSGYIIGTFGDVLRSFVTKFTIPEGVAGPVGIATLTYQGAQQGVGSLLRIVVMLSLSLAIMNILPFPALDGGRLFFILVEVVTRRRVSPRWEALVHGIGFALLMMLILAVTYGDIVKLF